MKKHVANAIWKGSVDEGSGNITTRSKALNNAPYSKTGRFADGPGTNPDELIAASHAGCFAMALSMFLGKEGYTPEALDVKAEVTMDPGKLQLVGSHLTLHAKIPGISEAKLLECANTAKDNCPISKALNMPITLDVHLV
ncbi:MAG: OsmC family protein [Candidatus Parvibacillus calidus]|jgi:osmotically inducible protein OsmC|nr:MAG: OsmC family protein [Candidatus Parvibacillus calidus]